ncbi:hypothetical protein BFW38_01705 [Terasakiispira papahanaumokuakeensis]|uniref:NERD domain-containing protein n=1 Tax=Terasakiispira papahanaumokuakeensis TaxID=197479 RepID=A0A1E2V612_9GAMM|nr:nuclease-related domain-containing protein [Terasakiispira papahanaumokuakeensis]ODC02448.1 hypothetical protein BFW38_01705 [Terasakiispira papahanaumokuakeensis]
MILKEYKHRPDANSKSEENCAEVSTRLRNAFKTNEDVLVMSDVVVEVEERKVNVDHVVLHPYGITLINSRTLYGKIEVNYRQVWNRIVNGREIPMENPIELFKYVSRELRNKLNNHTAEVLTRHNGVQKGFEVLPIEVIFVQAPKTTIQGNGINQSFIMTVEQVTQSINRSFSSYKKREFQMYGGMESFKFTPSDMHATADLLMGNVIDRSQYPAAESAQTQAVKQGRRGIVRAVSTLRPHIIKGRDIKPGRQRDNEPAQ